MSETSIGTVVQLSPHGQTDKIAVVSKSSEGEELVSLDDVYEVSGQESIGFVIRSANEYFKKGRLHRKSFATLKIDGCESFLPVFDKHNARMGGESFIGKLKDGFITMVKAIRRWLGAVVDWILTRLKSLFGFTKTEKEIASAEEHLQKLKPLLRTFMLRAFGGSPEMVSFDIDEFMKTLPTGVTGKEVMTIIKNRSQNSTDVVQAMDKAAADIEKAYTLLVEATQKARSVKSNYTRAMDNFKRVVNAKKVTEADIVELQTQLSRMVMEQLNPEKYRAMAETLVSKIYDIEIKDLGLESNFKAISDELKSKLEQTKAAIPEDAVVYYKQLQKSYIERVNKADYSKITGDELKALKDIVNDKDAEVLDQVVGMYPEHAELIGSYLAFSQSVTNFNESVNLISEVLQRCSITASSISKWLTSLQTLGMAYVTQDVCAIIEAHKEVTPGHEAEFFSKNADGSLGLPRLMPDDTKVLKHYYPDFDLSQEFTDAARVAQQLPQVKTPLNNLLKELGIGMKV